MSDRLKDLKAQAYDWMVQLEIAQQNLAATNNAIREELSSKQTNENESVSMDNVTELKR